MINNIARRLHRSFGLAGFLCDVEGTGVLEGSLAFKSEAEDSSQGRRKVGGGQIYALLICISNFNGNEKPASSHLLG